MAARGAPLRSAKGFASRPVLWPSYTTTRDTTDLLRGPLRDAEAAREPLMPCMAVVSYVYDHHERDLGRRLMRTQHDHHALGIATLHTHLDHDHCLEVAVLRGEAKEVQDFAQALIRERGVRFGGVNLLPAPEHPPAA